MRHTHRISQTRRTLINAAFSPPSIEPVLNLNHHDYLLKEMRWLAVDVAQVGARRLQFLHFPHFSLFFYLTPVSSQERLWKMTTARQVAYMAAAVGRTRLTQQLDKITPKSAREAAKAATLPSYTSRPCVAHPLSAAHIVVVAAAARFMDSLHPVG